MPSVIQRSFAGGEIAPSMYARADQVKYQTGLKTCRNFLVMRHGGVANRTGSRFVCEVKDSTKHVRMVRFVFNEDQTYVLEFGHQYMRVIRKGVQLPDPLDPDQPYELATPYMESELSRLQYVQSGDVVTIVHENHQPMELRRTDHTTWTLTEITFAPGIEGPTNCAGTRGSSGGRRYRYKITAVQRDTYEESLPGLEVIQNIQNITKTDPVEVTLNDHGFRKGDEIFIDDVVGMTELNGKVFTIGSRTVNTFKLKDIDGTNYDAYVSGGTVRPTAITISAAAKPTENNPHELTWDDVPGAVEYNVYKEKNGVFGYAGTTADTFFEDDDIAPDIGDTPPIFRNPFEDDVNPGVVSYFQQRLMMARSTDEPEKVWASKTANFHNFTIRSPIRDDDSVTFSIAGRRVNDVRHMFEIGRLVILTSGGEWTANGDADGVIKPNAINLRQQGHSGSSFLSPLLIGNSALYVQARGSVVRDLKYDLESDGYTGRDLTVFASHLFDGHAMVDWDFAETPHSIAWAVRDDGMLLGLTYIREHEVWGWHRHDTDGVYENVCIVPEGKEDAVYVVVRRNINGQDKRYIERFESRQIEDVVDAFFVDSGLTYDGRNGDLTHTMTLTGGTQWILDETLTLTSSQAFFDAGDIGNAVHLTADGLTIRFEIVGYTSTTVVDVRASRDVPTAFQAVAINTWAKAVHTLAGLDHLEGKLVSVLADGNVEPQAVVSGGSITLQRPHAVVHAGLPITADMETLSLENIQGETLSDKRKLINEVSLTIESSRGIKVGTDSNRLTEYKQRSVEPWDAPIKLHTGVVKVSVGSSWDDNGRVFVRQDDPLPLSVLAVIPSGIISGSR